MALHFRRQHVGAVHRRAPAPQLGFDPDEYFSRTRDRGQGFLTDLFPILSTISVPTLDPLPPTTDSVIATPIVTPPTPTTAPTPTPTVPPTTPTLAPATTNTTPTLILTTSTPVQPIPTPVTTSQSPVPTTTPTKVAVVTLVSYTTESTSIAPSATNANASDNSDSTSSGTNTGAVVGGIFAALIAIVAIIAGIVFYMRRVKKRKEAAGVFDQSEFRRSARMLNDPPTHEDTVARGFNPPPMAERGFNPPPMLERYTSPAPTFGTQYGHPGPAYGQERAYSQEEFSTNHAGYGSQAQSFAQQHPMYTPQSPVEQYHAQPMPYPVLTRQASSTSDSDRSDRQAYSPTKLNRESLPAGDYVDLNRSSVSPFQAAQYVEISRRLNTQVPEGLTTPFIDRELPPLPPPDVNSPFADPASAPPSPGGGQYAIDRRHMEMEDSHNNRPVSTDSLGTNEQALDFPIPPSPALTHFSRHRIDSSPPLLPEISVELRTSMISYGPMLSVRDSGAHSGMLSPGVGTATHSRFPTTPSPLASSFGMPSPPVTTAEATFVEAPPTPRPAPAVVHDPKNRGTTYSMYDLEDAYGGI